MISHLVPLIAPPLQSNTQHNSSPMSVTIESSTNFLTYTFSNDADSVIAGLSPSESDSLQEHDVSVLTSEQCQMLEQYIDIVNTYRERTLATDSCNDACSDNVPPCDHATFLFVKGSETALALRPLLPRLQGANDEDADLSSHVSDERSSHISCQMDHTQCYYFAPYLFSYRPKISYVIENTVANAWFVGPGPDAHIQASLTAVVDEAGTTITATGELMRDQYNMLSDFDNLLYTSIDRIFLEMTVDTPVRPEYFVASYLQPIYAPMNHMANSAHTQAHQFSPWDFNDIKANLHLKQGLLDPDTFLSPGFSTHAFSTILLHRDKTLLDATYARRSREKFYDMALAEHAEQGGQAEPAAQRNPTDLSGTAEPPEPTETHVPRKLFKRMMPARPALYPPAEAALLRYKELARQECAELVVKEISRLNELYIGEVIDLSIFLFCLVCCSFGRPRLIYALMEYVSLLDDVPVALFKQLGLPEQFPILDDLAVIVDCICGIEYVYNTVLGNQERVQQVVRSPSVLKNSLVDTLLRNSRYSKYYKISYNTAFIPLYQALLETAPQARSLCSVFLKDTVHTRQRRPPACGSQETKSPETKPPHDAIVVDGSQPLKLVKDGNGLKLVEFVVRDDTGMCVAIRAPYDTYKKLTQITVCDDSNETVRAEIHRIIENQFKLLRQLQMQKASPPAKAGAAVRKPKMQTLPDGDDECSYENSATSTNGSTGQSTLHDQGGKAPVGGQDQDNFVFSPVHCEPQEEDILLTGITSTSTAAIRPICSACLEVKNAAPTILGVAQIMITEGLLVLPKAPDSTSTQGHQFGTINSINCEVRDLSELQDTERYREPLSTMQSLYLQRDIAIVKASCSPAVTVLDMDAYRDICIQLSKIVADKRCPVYFPDFTFNDYIGLGLYNSKVYYIHVSTAFHTVLLRFLFDVQYSRAISGPGSFLLPLAAAGFDSSLYTAKDIAKLSQSGVEADFTRAFESLLRKLLSRGPFSDQNNLNIADILDNTGENYGDTAHNLNRILEALAGSLYGSSARPGDLLDPESFVTVTVNDTTEVTHISNASASLAHLFGPFTFHGHFTSQQAMERATLLLRFLATFAGASGSMQEFVRVYAIAGNYCDLHLSVVQESYADTNIGSLSTHLSVKSIDSQLVGHFNADITSGQYRATVTSIFTPYSPLLVSKDYDVSLVQNAYIHTNLRSAQYIKWLSGSNSFRPHTFEESDVIGREAALLYIQTTANITDQGSQALLLNGSVKKKMEAWSHYGVSYRVCPTYVEDECSGDQQPLVIWDRDNIPTDHASLKKLADSVLNRGKYVTIPYGSESYGSVSLLDVMGSPGQASKADQKTVTPPSKSFAVIGSSSSSNASDSTIGSLSNVLSLVKQIQINPASVHDVNTLTALYSSADRPVSTGFHIMAATGQEASTHHIEEEQVCFGMLRVYINALMRILTEWIAIYAPSLLAYYDISITSTVASAPPDNTRSCTFGFNLFAATNSSSDSDSSYLADDDGKEAYGCSDATRGDTDKVSGTDPSMTLGLELPPGGAKTDTCMDLAIFNKETTQRTVSLSKYFSSSGTNENIKAVEECISRKSLYSSQFLGDHIAIVRAYKDITEAAAKDEILSASVVTNETDRSLRFLAYPYILFPIQDAARYREIYASNPEHHSDWSSLSPPPPRIPTTLQFFICQVYTGPDILFSLFTEPLITVPLLARTMQNLLARTMHAEQRASYVWQTIFPGPHFANCDQNLSCLSTWDKKVLTPKAILQDMKRRTIDSAHGLNPELWPYTLDPSCIHMGHLVYPSCYEPLCSHTHSDIVASGKVLGPLSALFLSTTRNAHIEPQAALTINCVPRINPYQINQTLLKKSQLVVPSIVTSDYINAELIRLCRTLFYGMDENFIKLVICRSQMLFSCINTGFSTKTNQSVYDMCGPNPIFEDIYYFATLGYKYLQTTVNTKQYAYPSPVTLIDIEHIISSIEMTHSLFVSNQKCSSYCYGPDEAKALREKISFFESDHKGISQKVEALLSANIFFHSYDHLARATLQEISSHRRHAFMPSVTLRSYKFLLNLFLIDNDESIFEPGFRNTNSAALISSLGALSADGCKNVLLFEILPSILLNHETKDWVHSSIDPEKPVYKVICSDIYIIAKFVSVICTRIEASLQILERIPRSCRQVGRYGTRTMRPFPLSRHNGRCAATTLFGYENVDYPTPCGHRIFYSSNQYFQLSESYNLAKCRCNMMRCPYCGGLGSNMGPVSGSYLPTGAGQYVELQSNSSNGIFSAKRCISGPEAEEKEVYPEKYGFAATVHDNYTESECMLNTPDSKTYHCYSSVQPLTYKPQPAVPLPTNALEAQGHQAFISSTRDRSSGHVEGTKGSTGTKSARGYGGADQLKKRAKQDYANEATQGTHSKDSNITPAQLLMRAKALVQKGAVNCGEGYVARNYGERLADIVRHLPPLDSYTFRALVSSEKYLNNRFVREYLTASLGHASVSINSPEELYNPSTQHSAESCDHMLPAGASESAFYATCQNLRYKSIYNAPLRYEGITDPVLLYILNPRAFDDFYVHTPTEDDKTALSADELHQLAQGRFQRYQRSNLLPLEQHIFPSHIQKKPDTYPTDDTFRGELAFLLRLMQAHIHQLKDDSMSNDFISYMYSLLGLYAYPLLSLKRPITTLLRRIDSFASRMATTSMNINYLSLYRPQKANILGPRSAILFLFLVFATRLPAPYGNLLPLSLPPGSDDIMLVVENTGGVARFSCITGSR